MSIFFSFSFQLIFCQKNICYIASWITGNINFKRKSHHKLVWYFLNHFNQLNGRCVLLNHHSFQSLHSLHSWWFSRTHLPTRWYQWFRKYHTRLLVGFPIVTLVLKGNPTAVSSSKTFLLTIFTNLWLEQLLRTFEVLVLGLGFRSY